MASLQTLISLVDITPRLDVGLKTQRMPILQRIKSRLGHRVTCQPLTRAVSVSDVVGRLNFGQSARASVRRPHYTRPLVIGDFYTSDFSSLYINPLYVNKDVQVTL